MDTILGIVQLTEIQKKNMGYMGLPSPFKGFNVWEDGTVIGVSESEPTQQQVLDAVAALAGLPETATQAVADAEFSFKLLMGRLNQTLAPMSILKLAPYTGAMQSYCDWKNWTGITAFLDGLVLTQIMTAEERGIVASCFQEQGITV